MGMGNYGEYLWKYESSDDQTELFGGIYMNLFDGIFLIQIRYVNMTLQ